LMTVLAVFCAMALTAQANHDQQAMMSMAATHSPPALSAGLTPFNQTVTMDARLAESLRAYFSHRRIFPAKPSHYVRFRYALLQHTDLDVAPGRQPLLL